MEQSSGMLISCAGGPVGNGLGMLVCLPFFLAKQAELCLSGACARKAEDGTKKKSVAMVVNCMVALLLGGWL